jgi:AcrR family transcriptional regulator
MNMLVRQCYIERVPKEVDHPARRRELADAACRVIARNGLSGTTLAQVAEESGWSIGSIRYYFPTKDELVASALWRVGERIDDRIRHRTGGGMTLNDLRTAATELLPLDADRREMSLVYLAFLAQAAVVPALADAAESAGQRLQEPLAARITHAVHAGELPAHLDPQHEAARLRVLLDGLRLQLITTPKHTPASWALAILDDHLTALAAAPAAARHPHDSRSQRR